ncbi:hypothetical protein GCM10027271_35400 [Saccharopolyspora gloriosae]|uniref:CAAX prenyl protease 2/Lysostaphin resistance protein A-like domain-containing protein n=1 Tax=Saccharopolyspora gloriosae TaxID=455344 RepID=A0A840NH29_9PSEU|nr:CPBP family intramembrane glutamic endopeptidase [Saccharopolyspora gloriosae]MBB5069568.1 hypothetical protein [Saccharopolyspora gloriosae]
MAEHDRTGRERRGPNAFYGLVLLLSLPHWALGAVIGSPGDLPLGLPASASMFVTPALAALLLARREHPGGARRLLARLRPRRADLGWYAFAVLLIPLVMLAAHTSAGGRLADLAVPWRALPVLVALFLIAAICEELGWTGHAYARSRRGGGLRVALLLGAFWAGWHVIPLIQAGRGATWIAAWGVGTIALRVLLCWTYDAASASVPTAVLGHAALNLASTVLPEYGSPIVAATMSTGFVVAAAATALPGWRRGTPALSHQGTGRFGRTRWMR